MTSVLILLSGVHCVEYCFEFFEQSSRMWKCVANTKRVTTAAIAGF